MATSKTEYTYNQLRLLWYLKKHGPVTDAGRTNRRASILSAFTDALGLSQATVRHCLRALEQRSIILRTYSDDRPKRFGDQTGGMRLTRIELVDPKMKLPPEPAAPTLGTVMRWENQVLYDMTASDPERDDVIDALVERIAELQAQVDKLGEVIEGLASENARLADRQDRTPPAHLSQPVRDALPDEVWDRLTHQAKRRTGK